MEFRDISSANLVFASVLDHSRNLEQITSEWELNHEDFSTQDLDQELKRLVDNQIIKQTDHGLKAYLGSQPFHTELENYIEYMHSSEESDLVLNDLSSYYGLLRSTGFRTQVFRLEQVKNFYSQDPDTAKENPLKMIYKVLKILEGFEEPETKLGEQAAKFR